MLGVALSIGVLPMYLKLLAFHAVGRGFAGFSSSLHGLYLKQTMRGWCFLMIEGQPSAFDGKGMVSR